MPARLEIGSKLKTTPSFLFSTMSWIPTTLNILPLFPVSEGGAVEMMTDNVPMDVIIPGDS